MWCGLLGVQHSRHRLVSCDLCVAGFVWRGKLEQQQLLYLALALGLHAFGRSGCVAAFGLTESTSIGSIHARLCDNVSCVRTVKVNVLPLVVQGLTSCGRVHVEHPTEKPPTPSAALVQEPS